MVGSTTSMARKPTRRRVPCASERRGETSSAALAAMNSRRFIRSSLQLEETGPEYHVSMVVALTAGANAASQMPRVAQDGYGSSTDLTAPKFDFRFTPESGLKSDIGPCPFRAMSGSRTWLPQSCASHSRTDPFLCAAFSPYTRLITDVAIFPVLWRRSECASLRRSTAVTAVEGD